MPTPARNSRRTFLKASSVGGLAVLAGCISAPNAEEPSDPTPTQSEPNESAELDPPMETDVDGIAADPTDVPPPVDWDEPRHHEIEMTTTERVAEIEPGVTFNFMTFDDQVPGPLLRVRRGDTISLELTNDEANAMPHNIDLHAVYGPGGGAVDTTVDPGETAEIQFRVEYPGIHIYHCAVPNMDYHISAGMFGAILVEPEEGLPAVDREFYFGQHELYTTGDPGQEGHHEFDLDAMAREEPTYVVTNGEAYAFTSEGSYGPLEATQGERIRVYLANGGPNLISAWHPIGNVWSNLYRDGDLLSPPSRYVETTPVAPGTVTAGELETPVPGPIKLVDHALSRVVRKGRLAVIDVDGTADDDIYDPAP
ncbi:MAG: copper-containing nitrite reductase [Halobacteriota archaeon]